MHIKMIMLIIIVIATAIFVYLLLDLNSKSSKIVYVSAVIMGLATIIYVFKDNKFDLLENDDDDVSDIISNDSLESSVNSYFSGS